jgi:preprotein translocase subunit SecD
MRTRRHIGLAAAALVLAGCGHHGGGHATFAIYDWEAQHVRTGGTTLQCRPGACFEPGSQKVTVAGTPVLTENDVDRASVGWELDAQTGQPTVYLGFTRAGAKRLTRLSRKLARRGARLGTPQHFLLAVSGNVYAAPYVDYRVNPQGIPADNGMQFAAASVTDAKHVVKTLRGG